MRYGKRVAALAAITSLVLVACGGDDDDEVASTPTTPRHRSTAGPSTAGTEAPRTDHRQTAGTAGGRGAFSGEIPCDQQHEGKTVSILSPVRNSENDPDAIQLFTDFWAPLVECTGVTIDFQGTDQFEVQAPVLLQGGSPPDVIDFPQPGLLRTLAASLITLPENVAAHASSDFIPGWEGLYTVDDEIKAMPWRANVKSMVWYSPAAFEEGGYEVPETLEELTALSDQIVADGGTPWCAGIESGVATGWPITDWFEDFMLRINGPEVYDQWVNHEIPFNDPQVMAVADAVGSYPQEPRLHGRREQRHGDRHDQVPGRRRADHHGRLLHAPPGELLLRAVPGTGRSGPPDDAAADITFFYLPVAEAGDPKVMLGAGDLLAAGTDKPETWDVILYATSNEYAVAMANGHRGALAPERHRPVVDHRSAAGVVRRAAGELGDLPLRRCRHDARRGRVRHVLDGGDGVDRRWRAPRTCSTTSRRAGPPTDRREMRAEGPGLRLRALRSSGSSLAATAGGPGGRAGRGTTCSRRSAR